MEVYFKDLREEYNIIDIRDKEEYNKGHFINAINIPYNLIICFPSVYLSKDKTYYIYCTSGIRSKKVCDLLRIMHYKVINVKDGYKNKLF